MESGSKKKAKMEDPQAEKSSSSPSVVDDLPTQILMEILSRLPIRTLMAIRCVCKSWLLLTSDTDFAKLHLTRAPTELLRRRNNPNYGAITTDLALGEFEMKKGSVSKVHFNFLFQLPTFNVGPDNDVDFGDSHPVSLVNSCRGFFCYSGFFNTFAVIWNPIIGQFITVPAPNVKRGEVLNCSYGFGFSPKENKFKLLRMRNRRVTNRVTGSISSKDKAEVLTFEEGSSSWRNVGYCPSLPMEEESEVFVERAIHWLGEDHNNTVIVSFDFDSEKFGEVLPPPWSNLDDAGTNQLKIGVLGGCLSLIDSTIFRIHIWVMKEYGVRDSWTKAFKIDKEILNIDMGYGFEFIRFLENGELLMLNHTGCLVAYHPTKERFRSLGRAPSSKHKSIAYTPNLFRLEDAMMRKNVYTLNVKLRPVLKICRSLIVFDRADPKEYWRLNEENSAEHLTSHECSKALSRNKKKQSSEELREELRKECKEQKELVEILQQKNSRIEQLKEQIKQFEELE